MVTSSELNHHRLVAIGLTLMDRAGEIERLLEAANGVPGTAISRCRIAIRNSHVHVGCVSRGNREPAEHPPAGHRGHSPSTSPHGSLRRVVWV